MSTFTTKISSFTNVFFLAILVLKMDLYELIPHINTSESAIQFLRHFEFDSLYNLLHFRCFFTHTYIFHFDRLVKVDIFVVNVDISWYRGLRSKKCQIRIVPPKLPLEMLFLRKEKVLKKNFFWDHTSL